MGLQSIADEHYNARKLMTLTAGTYVGRLWRRSVDPSNVYRSWRAAIPQASEALSEFQTLAAIDGQRYMAATMLDAGIRPTGPALNPSGFAGFTYPIEGAPPRMLEEALEFPAYRSLQALRDGASSDRALAAGLDSLETMASTAVADAGRQADGVVAATEDKITGYVRQVEPEACARCAILAGRRYRSNTGFSRHPNCLCEHVPIVTGGEAVPVQDPYELFNELPAGEQERIYTKAGAQAVRDGADINQVVNARRGMSRTDGGSLITSEGMVRTRSGGYRGNAGRTMQRNSVNGARMMPEEIYKRAAGNQRIINEQLERYGYILPGGQQADGVLNPQRSGWYGETFQRANRAQYGN